jgi:hypothetical protein
VSDVFEDVEEGMRQESIERLARKYGPIALTVVAIAIAAAIGFVLFQNWRTDQRREAAEAFIEAQNTRSEGDAAAALTDLEALASAAPAGYALLAVMERAAALEAQGDLDGAIEALDRAASMTRDPIAKQTAQMRAAYLAAETKDLAALDARLSPIVDERGPMSYLARELIGVEAFEAGDMARARSEFGYLQAAPDAPPEIKQRVARFAALIPTEQAPAAAAASPTPAAADTGDKQ